MAKDAARYVGLLFNRASKGSILLTDRLTVLLVPFTTLLLWFWGARMTDSIAETLALGVAITVGAVVVLRLMAASYGLWTDDQAEKRRLQAKLDRPFQREREIAFEHVAKLRSELSDSLARLLAVADLVSSKTYENETFRKGLVEDYAATIRRTRELINALSYDVPLRIAAHTLASLATRLTATASGGGDVAELMEKMQSMKKVTFRLIHKRETDSTGELLAMLEVQNIRDGAPKETMKDLPPAPSDGADDREMLDWIRRCISDPEIATELRREIERGAAE